MPALAAAFVEAAGHAGNRAVFFGTEGGLAGAPAFARLRIGEQPTWEPVRWSARLAKHRSLREQLRRARAKGVGVRESHDPAERAEAAAGHGPLARLLEAWRAARPMATMGFLVHPEPFLHAPERRLLVAEREGRPVGLLSLVPMGPDAWLAEHLLRAPDAPNGTAELLIHDAMQRLAAEGATAVSLGLAPLAGHITWWLRVARTLSRPLFNFAGLAAFKRKLQPDSWTPIYLAHPRSIGPVRALLDSLRAFAEGSLLRFAAASIVRGPTWALRLLEWLLVPWTALLAMVPTDRWFPSVSVHLAWVLFDIALWSALRLRRKRRRAWLSPWLAMATTMDAMLTGWQIAAWNAARMQGPSDAVVLAIGLLGPAAASVLLWGAYRRERAPQRIE